MSGADRVSKCRKFDELEGMSRTKIQSATISLTYAHGWITWAMHYAKVIGTDMTNVSRKHRPRKRTSNKQARA